MELFHSALKKRNFIEGENLKEGKARAGIHGGLDSQGSGQESLIGKFSKKGIERERAQGEKGRLYKILG